MTFIKAIFLGIIQGLTEFLPISSSGHLALAQYFLNVKETPLVFDIMLHVGTLGAIILVFIRDIIDIILTIFGHETSSQRLSNFKTIKDGRMFLVYIIIGSIPTMIIALLSEKLVKQALINPIIVSIMLILTGVILWFSGINRSKHITHPKINSLKAFIIGISQGIAVLPGISRSGSTISTALILGISSEESARYSLLLSIPAIIGATIFEIRDINIIDVPMPMIISGTLTAFIVGYIAIRFLLKILKQGYFYRFAYYCWFIGIAAIIAYFIK